MGSGMQADPITFPTLSWLSIILLSLLIFMPEFTPAKNTTTPGSSITALENHCQLQNHLQPLKEEELV